MSRRKKTILIVLVVFVGLPVAELAREEAGYLVVSHNLKTAYERAENGMTREAIKTLAGEPEAIRLDNGEETWYWDAAVGQGFLWHKLELTSTKGHYTLTIEFDGQGKVTQKWGGVN